MMRNQRGVTMIGWIFLLLPMVIVLYAGLIAGPIYFNYFKVVSAMEKTATALKSDGQLAAPTIRNALEKRFDTGYIDDPRLDEIGIKKNGKGGWDMVANYERTQKLFGNFHITLAFDRTVTIGRDAAAE
jgi:hypothetical protein